MKALFKLRKCSLSRVDKRGIKSFNSSDKTQFTAGACFAFLNGPSPKRGISVMRNLPWYKALSIILYNMLGMTIPLYREEDNKELIQFLQLQLGSQVSSVSSKLFIQSCRYELVKA